MGRRGQIFGDHGEQFDDPGLDGLKLALKFLPMFTHEIKPSGVRLSAQARRAPLAGACAKMERVVYQAILMASQGVREA